MAEQGKMEFVKGKLIEKTLKRETETWTLYTLTIETEDGKGNYSCFSTLGVKEGSKSLKLENLKVGIEYSFGVTENEKGKTISYVNVPKDFSKKTDNATQTTSKKFGSGGELKKIEFNKESEIFKKFFIEYCASMHKAKKEVTINHFTGYTIRFFAKDLGQDELVQWLDSVFEDTIKPEAERLVSDAEVQM